MRKEHGFTLIELLIVLAILGILVGIVAMSVGDLTNTASTTGMNSEKETVQTAIDTWNTIDVTVNLSPTIAAQTSWTQIDADAGDAQPYFHKYLKRDTKYYYQWGEGGADLQVDADGE
ncbi:MAG: prepilin-type N-terminal cleavage/methylation domain-containing protein [Chloroflexi bacterium]|nr:prepilin-type N-terminal cleavage/methylation domain-containing protein [Chloroflexota bacterium]